MIRLLYPTIFSAALLCAGPAARAADDAAAKAVPTKHQMMKECMAKEKASDGGMPKEDMKKECKDVTETESENAKAEQESGEQAPSTPPNQ